MDFKKLGLFQLISEKMDYHQQRQAVLSQNISNADTPDYRPQDLVPFDFKVQLRQAARPQAAQTHVNHRPGTLPVPGDFREMRERVPYEVEPDGNAVILEEQLMKLGENAGTYQLVTNLYRKQLGMFRVALSRNGQ